MMIANAFLFAPSNNYFSNEKESFIVEVSPYNDSFFSFSKEGAMKRYVQYAAIPAATIIIFLIFFFTGRNEPTDTLSLTTIEQQQPIEQQEQHVEAEPQPAEVTVDVKGAVRHPGVYTFTEEQRIIDAIEAAGGYIDGANSTLINHAQKLTDALVIYVPIIGEEPPQIQAQTAVGIASASGSTENARININTATESELQELPGIGPAKAQAIVQHRDEHGPFASEEQLTDVSGIGDRTFEQLSDLITVK